jgi:hypothetical protein
MKHSVRELYYIPGEIAPHYTLEGLAARGIQLRSPRDPDGCGKALNRHFVSVDQMIIGDEHGTRMVYFYGERTWFDTKEERDEYRAVENARRKAQNARYKVKAKITHILDDMSLEQLEMLLAKLGGEV